MWLLYLQKVWERGRCYYCFYRRYEKGVDVATVFTEGLRNG